MKKIPLTQGKFTIVDDADYEWLSKFKWCAVKDYQTFYAVRNICENGRWGTSKMHREILGLKSGDKRQCDHVDGDGLNNGRTNLRTCTNQQNNFNRKPYNGSSKFKGVFWDKKRRKWRALIKINQKKINLGRFQDETDAARAYDIAAKRLFGEFARTNLKEEK